MRPDYCPIGEEPCQSVRIEPCSTKRRRVSYVCPICAASMIESDEALLRQALDALAYWLEHGETPGSHDIIQRTHDVLQERLI